MLQPADVNAEGALRRGLPVEVEGATATCWTHRCFPLNLFTLFFLAFEPEVVAPSRKKESCAFDGGASSKLTSDHSRGFPVRLSLAICEHRQYPDIRVRSNRPELAYLGA